MLLMHEDFVNFSPGLIASLRRASSIVALTGAGISAESGVPTFREAQSGLWARYNPQELATPRAFRQNPQLVWEWYSWRREMVSQARPNPGHFALAEMENYVPSFTLITQNVDGLHYQAGSRSIIELHGNIHRTKCSKEGVIVESWNGDGEIPPRCPHCGSFLRPDVVWFGESLPREALMSAQLAARNCDVFISIGTSTVVEPAASLPFMALEHGAVVVEVNPELTPLSSQAEYVIQAPSGQALPSLVEAVWEQAKGANENLQ